MGWLGGKGQATTANGGRIRSNQNPDPDKNVQKLLIPIEQMGGGKKQRDRYEYSLVTRAVLFFHLRFVSMK